MVKVAVVGGGQIARKVYLPVLAMLEDVELSVLIEPQADRREQLARKYRFGRAVASIDEMRAGEAQAAFLLTPEAVRLAPGTALLDRGLDVLCEKPLAQSMADAEALARAADENKRVLMVGFNRRFMPVLRKAKEFLSGRKLDLCRVHKQGANIINHTIHILDAMRFLCGDAVEVQACGNFQGDKEITSAALVRFDSGAIGIFQTSARVGTRMEEFEAHGEGFSVFVNAPASAVMCAGGKQETFRPETQTWYVESQQVYGFVDEITHFLECVKTRRTPQCHAADALKTHKLAFDILNQMKLHGRQL